MALILVCCLPCGRLFAAADEAPKLRPPRGTLTPLFWEQHGWLISILAVVTLTAVGLLIAWLRRPKPVVLTTPEALARKALEALQTRPEDGTLAVEVSRVLRRYVVAACGLPDGEMTTAELHRVLQASPRANQKLAGRLMELLRECDVRKFAPVQPPPTPGLVARALELVVRMESHRRETAVPVTSGDSPTAA